MRKKKGPCSYNIGVECDGSDCSRCGWCPAVKERRLKDRGIEIHYQHETEIEAWKKMITGKEVSE